MLFTSQEAVSYLGLDRQGLSQPLEALRWLCRTGKLRYTKVGRYLRFRREWLDELVARNEVLRETDGKRVPGESVREDRP